MRTNFYRLFWLLCAASMLVAGCGDTIEDETGDTPVDTGNDDTLGDTESSEISTDIDVGDTSADTETTSEEEDENGYAIGNVSDIMPIEDFDDGNAENNIGGTWLSYDDSIDNGESEVEPGNVYAGETFSPEEPGYGGTGYAAHVTGTTGSVLTWDYIGFLTTLDPDALCPDAKPTEIEMGSYDGIQFMVKGETTGSQLTFKIPHKKDGVEDNCTENGVAADSLTAYADYMMDVGDRLSSDWTLVRIAFDELAQPDWGTDVELKEVLAHAKELVWEYQYMGGDMNLWIDNIALYKK
jgi:hypothetical protein